MYNLILKIDGGFPTLYGNLDSNNVDVVVYDMDMLKTTEHNPNTLKEIEYKKQVEIIPLHTLYKEKKF
jgi:hypothetical protein